MSKEFEHKLRAGLVASGAPAGAFGRLERVALQVARLQGRVPPRLGSAGLFVFAGDHGVAGLGISSEDAGRTRLRAEAMAEGRGLVARLAAVADLDVTVIDAAIEEPANPGARLLDRRLRAGTERFTDAPAMTGAERDSAIAAGQDLAAQSPHDCLGVGYMGRGGLTSANLLVHRLVGVALASVVSRGEGLDEEGLFRKHKILSEASARVPFGTSTADLLAQFGGVETAMMVGAMIGAAGAGKLILVDGYGACVAALIAAQQKPELREAMVFSQLTRVPGHQIVLDALAAKPLLQLDADMADGAGVVLAWPLVRSALALLDDGE